MAELDDVRSLLRKLQGRLAAGEISREQFRDLVADITIGLTPGELGGLGLTPTPMPGGTPRPLGPTGKPRPLGPSGARGSGMETRLERVADLDLKPGDVLLGKYKIVRELGRGGFGAVFEAEDLRLGGIQAVKVLDPSMVAREDLLERFRREVRVMRNLVHPRIARVFDYDEDVAQGVALLAMEYVAGGSVLGLQGRFRKGDTPFPVMLAMTILEQALDALAEAHKHGVIHRDVTPANLLLAGNAEELVKDPTGDPCVKLIDFGIAGLVERTELSQKSRAVGTAAYVAPEVLDPRVEVTAAADIYGAGVVAYHILTDALPLGRTKAPEECRPDIDRRTSDLIMGFLETRPQDRPTAAEAKGAVGEIRAGLRKQAAGARARAERVAGLRAKLAQALAVEDEAGVDAAVRDLAGELGGAGAQNDGDLQKARAWVEQRERARREAQRAEQERARLHKEAEARRAEEERAQLRREAEARRAEEERAQLQREVEARRTEGERARFWGEFETRVEEERRREELAAESARAAMEARIREARRRKVRAVWGAVAVAVVVAVFLGWGVVSMQRAAERQRQADRERVAAEQARQEQDRRAEAEREQAKRPTKGSQLAFGVYSNGRFRFSIEYPSDLLSAQGESENGDGQRFTSADGKATLAVWGSWNALGKGNGPRSVGELFAQECKADGAGGAKRALTYKAQKDDWFVISGTAGQKIFYEKSLVTKDVVVSFLLEYDESVKTTWDPVVAKIGKSLRLKVPSAGGEMLSFEATVNADGQEIRKEFAGRSYVLVFGRAPTFDFDVVFDGKRYSLYDAPHGAGRNSFVDWQIGQEQDFSSNQYSGEEYPFACRVRLVDGQSEGGGYAWVKLAIKIGPRLEQEKRARAEREQTASAVAAQALEDEVATRYGKLGYQRSLKANDGIYFESHWLAEARDTNVFGSVLALGKEDVVMVTTCNGGSGGQYCDAGLFVVGPEKHYSFNPIKMDDSGYCARGTVEGDAVAFMCDDRDGKLRVVYRDGKISQTRVGKAEAAQAQPATRRSTGASSSTSDPNACYLDPSCNPGRAPGRGVRNAASGACVGQWTCSVVWKCAEGPRTGLCGGGQEPCVLSPGCGSSVQTAGAGICCSLATCTDKLTRIDYRPQ